MPKEELLLLVGPLYKDLNGPWLKLVPTDSGMVVVLGPKARALLGLRPIKVNVATFEDQVVRRKVYRRYREAGYAFIAYEGNLAIFAKDAKTRYVAAQKRDPRARTVRGWLERYPLQNGTLDVWSSRPYTLSGVSANHSNVAVKDLRELA